MNDSPQRTSLWQSVRQLPGRTPLRVKLVTALLALVAIALAVISVAGIVFLRNYLIGQADGSLSSIIDSPRPPQSYILNYLAGNQRPSGEQTAVDWLAGRAPSPGGPAGTRLRRADHAHARTASSAGGKLAVKRPAGDGFRLERQWPVAGRGVPVEFS